jgi:MFS family permease
MALCDSLLPAVAFRALADIAMAGMYMPGLRALTHGVEGATRARIAAWYTSSSTIGASLSFLFGRVGTLLGWRSAFVIAGILGATGVDTANPLLLPATADRRYPGNQPFEPRRPPAPLASLRLKAVTNIPIAVHWSVASNQRRCFAPTTGKAPSHRPPSIRGFVQPGFCAIPRPCSLPSTVP